MKPAPFDFVRPSTVSEVGEVLSASGGDGKVIAGGQSLMPMINFRLVKPSILVDINGIPSLSQIKSEGARLRLGATVRHYMTATDPLIKERIPILHEAMHHVAHLTVRNRGTFCGSVCHADPAAEMPMMTLLLNGQITAYSVRGERRIAAPDFFQGSLMNSLEPDEFVTSIEIDTLSADAGWGFEEFAKRHGDFALSCVATTMSMRAGVASGARFAMMGVGETPLRIGSVEALIEGREVTPRVINEVVELLNDTLQPNSDLHASADYRRHLSGALARRALEAAWRRAARFVEIA